MREGGSGRDRNIDILRGYCIVAMVTGHMLYPSLPNAITHVQLAFGGEMGFVFLSGFVLGMVHPRRVQRDGRRGAMLKLVRRAGTLWLAHVVVLAAAMLAREATGLGKWVPPPAEVGGWANALLAIATLRLQPDLFDILPMYVLFLLLSPVVLALLERGRWLIALGASTAVWALAQVGPGWMGWPWSVPGYHPGFRPGAWQLLFFGGMCVGYHRATLEQVVWPRIRGVALPAAYGASIVLFAWSQTIRPALGLRHLMPDWLFQAVFDREPCRAGRILYFLTMLVVAYHALRHVRWPPLAQRVFTWLEVFGTRSLYTFLLQTVLAFAISMAPAAWTPRPVREVAMAAIIVGLYGMARHRVLGRVIPN